jgi:hypothetical protein
VKGWLSAKKNDLAYTANIFQEDSLVILKLHLVAAKVMIIETSLAPVIALVGYEELERVDRSRDEFFPLLRIVF